MNANPRSVNNSLGSPKLLKKSLTNMQAMTSAVSLSMGYANKYFVKYARLINNYVPLMGNFSTSIPTRSMGVSGTAKGFNMGLNLLWLPPCAAQISQLLT